MTFVQKHDYEKQTKKHFEIDLDVLHIYYKMYKEKYFGYDLIEAYTTLIMLFNIVRTKHFIF